MKLKRKMTFIRVDDLQKIWVKDPKYRLEYRVLEEEFSDVAALIEARTPCRINCESDVGYPRVD